MTVFPLPSDLALTGEGALSIDTQRIVLTKGRIQTLILIYKEVNESIHKYIDLKSMNSSSLVYQPTLPQWHRVSHLVRTYSLASQVDMCR